MDEKYKRMFFDKFVDKFIKDLEFLNEETLYKVLWSLVKAKRLVVKNDAIIWMTVREVL